MLLPRSFLFIILGFSLGTQGRALIFDSTPEPAFNTTAPTGALAHSGWQYQGQWRSAFLGTPIAPQFFITAKHVLGEVGEQFVFQGGVYTTTAFFDDPTSDLRIWKVDGTFPVVAPIYSKGDEMGKSLVVTGRGTQRGSEVRSGGVLKGWKWGDADTVPRWGTNRVAAIRQEGGTWGDLLQATFDHGADVNEATLSVGDSSGAVFLNDDGIWKLAGINLTVDGPYSTGPSGSNPVNAALFEQDSFFANDGGGWTPRTGAQSWYATRISSHLAWISSIVGPLAFASPPPAAMQNLLPVRDRSSGIHPQLYYSLAVPPAATELAITLRGGTGNADLYLKRGSPPTTNDFDYASNVAGNRDVIRVASPQAGEWFILLQAAPSYHGATLRAAFRLAPGVVTPPVFVPGGGVFAGKALVRILSFTRGAEIHVTVDGTEPVRSSPLYRTPFFLSENATLKARAFRNGMSDSAIATVNVEVTPAAAVTDLQSGVPIPNLAGSGASAALFRIAVPIDQARLKIESFGASGAAWVLVRRGAAPTATVFDYRFRAVPGHERLVISNPEAGDWFILLRGARDFSDATLKAEFQ